MIEAASWAKALGALGIVLVLIWAAARRLKAFAGPMRAGRRLAVQEILPVDGRRRLFLIRCDGREVLLLTGGTQDAVIGWLPPQEAPGCSGAS
jgi:flagellar protein FliO/FliZ